jgi:tetratricopeptide (TPR) repeat protein
MAKDRMPRRWPIVVTILALMYLVGVVFWPIPGFSFISLDVDPLVQDNPTVHGLTVQNIKRIFTTPCIASYYPVRSLTFALDYEIWGLNPAGFKLTGALIHLTNVLLVLWLIARLFRYRAAAEEPAERQRVLDNREVALAAFSAGVFAIHPVVVEPVTWVAGREELLMTLGALGCIHFHLTARCLCREGGRSGRAAACFVGAAVCCAFGCLSNAVGAAIPVLITTWEVLTLPKPKLGRILRGTLALWLIGAATCVVKILIPSGPRVAMPWVTLAKQPGVVLAGYWLNLKTLAWPTKLSLSYEYIWPDDLPVAQVALGAVAAAATCVLIWIVRRRTRILFGLLWFCLALAPASQLIPHHLQRADRYLYLPLVGLAVAAAMAIGRVRHLVKSRAAVVVSAAGGVGLLLLLVTLSAHQVQKWRDDVTLWEHGVAVAPNNPRAHGYLADAYQDVGLADRAVESYRKTLQIAPNYIPALNNFAICLTSGHTSRLDDHLLAVELAERGCLLTEWLDPDLTYTLARAHTTLANTYEAAGQYGLAIDHFCKAIEADPEYDMPLFNLALVLSTCRDENQRDPQMAVQFAERGCQLAVSPDAHRLSILATVYGEVGRFEDAVAVMQQAIEAARTNGGANELGQLRNYLRLFENRTPLTASPDGLD